MSEAKCKHQMLLVSAQPMPNFLPILNSELKPESVTLVVSDKMKDRAEWLKKEIAKHQVEILPDIEIGGTETDINAIQESLMAWEDKNSDLMKDSVLNATGGTKPMAIAAQEIYRMAGRPVFYLDVATDNVSWVSGANAGLKLEKSPTLSQVFGLNGLTVESGDFKSIVENEKWKHFCDEIASSPDGWALALGVLNDKASTAVNEVDFARSRRDKDEALMLRYGNHELATPKWNEMLEMLHADELISGTTASERFVSAEAARFCAGIWLEHYVFSVLKGFGFDKKRTLMNAVVVDSKGNRNELDSVVIHRNTCYVIEDKTKNMKVKSGSMGNVADQTVYKLAQVTKNLGIRTKGILISARQVRPVDKYRAKAYGVEIIDWLPDLKSQLSRIMGLA